MGKFWSYLYTFGKMFLVDSRQIYLFAKLLNVRTQNALHSLCNNNVLRHLHPPRMPLSPSAHILTRPSTHTAPSATHRHPMGQSHSGIQSLARTSYVAAGDGRMCVWIWVCVGLVRSLDARWGEGEGSTCGGMGGRCACGNQALDLSKVDDFKDGSSKFKAVIHCQISQRVWANHRHSTSATPFSVGWTSRLGPQQTLNQEVRHKVHSALQ